MCLDCNIDTGKHKEHYFVHTLLWIEVVGTKLGMLCVGCFEKRLGRKLNKYDFPDVTVNDPKYEDKSQRLADRLVSY